MWYLFFVFVMLVLDASNVLSIPMLGYLILFAPAIIVILFVLLGAMLITKVRDE